MKYAKQSRYRNMDLYLHVGMFTTQRGRHWRLRWSERLMEIYLQFGYGMMEHCRHLISEWDGGTVVLSPRDLNGEQLSRLSTTITKLSNGHTLLDPQLYLPHAEHQRLCSHDYWPANYETGTFWQGPALTNLLTQLRDLNQTLKTRAFILPGLLASSINADWLEIQRAILEEANALTTDLPLIATIALSADATRDQDEIALLLETAAGWKAHGYYVVCEHPNGNYLVDDPNWLANVLDIVAGLRLGGAEVILGYCNHQLLVAAAAKASAVCSGTWMNVRSFPPDKFRTVYEEEIRQRATWYYCPQALSEYKIPFLDIAHRQKLLHLLAPPSELDGEYVNALFDGAQPSSVGFTEQAAFRHYLHCLRGQCAAASKASFDETIETHEQLLNNAETVLNKLVAAGIRGQQRDFSNIVDVNRAALSLLTSTRGPLLRRKWSSM